MTLTIALSAPRRCSRSRCCRDDRARARGDAIHLRRKHARVCDFACRRGGASARRAAPVEHHAAARRAVDRRAFPHRCAVRLLSRRGRSRRREREPVRARLWPHETAPQRVLPFYPAFLAGMTLVVMADDAFTFLFVLGIHVARVLGAGDVAPPRARQRARRLRLSGHGELRHARACCSLSACWPARTASTRSPRCAPRTRQELSARWF